LNNQDIHALASSGNNIFAGTSAATGFYLSTNNGTDWILKNEGLTNVAVNTICISQNYVFIGTYSNGVLKRDFSELNGVQPVSSQIPNSFALYQNYPNPFNPSTKIKFDILANSGLMNQTPTRLEIYDVLGKEVAILVNEKLHVGSYEVEWNAAHYPSGVYFYKLVSGNFIQTKKLILIK
jgi:hypothetical protein